MENTAGRTDKKYNLVIEPGRGEKNYWKDLWRYRELFYILTWRDVKVKYKQTVIGVLWSVLRPLLAMIVFTFVFSRLAKFPADIEAPYALFVLVAMLPWQFFSTSLSEGSNSLVTNANLVSKIYFPRLIIPTSTIIAGFIDFLISFVILFLMMIYYRFVPPVQIVFFPLFLLLAFLTSFSISLLLTAMNVRYRDFRYVIPFIVQFGLYLSPVGFSSRIIPSGWILLYDLNPMVGIINGFRWCMLGGSFDSDTAISLGVSMLITLFFLVIGIRYFRKTEKTFADII